MICRVGEVVRRGRIVSVSRDVDPATVAAAVRDGSRHWNGKTVAVAADPPTPVHEHVGCLREGMGLRTRTALARAGRTLGLSTPYDAELREVREALAPTNSDGAERLAENKREAAAEAGATETLRERVAAARGRLAVRREHGLETAPAEADLAAAVRDLSEAETSAAAAAQNLERARTKRQERRDELDERFRLEDRAANLERDARAHLADRLRERYAAAVADVPGGPSTGDPFAVDGLTAGLAVARVADLSAPVVVACDRFDSPARASEWLDAPVIEI